MQSEKYKRDAQWNVPTWMKLCTRLYYNRHSQKNAIIIGKWPMAVSFQCMTKLYCILWWIWGLSLNAHSYPKDQEDTIGRPSSWLSQVWLFVRQISFLSLNQFLFMLLQFKSIELAMLSQYPVQQYDGHLPVYCTAILDGVWTSWQLHSNRALSLVLSSCTHNEIYVQSDP